MTIVLQAAKGKLYAGTAQADAIARMGGQCRYLWNLFLAESIERYRAEKKFVFYSEMSARLPKLLKSDPKLAGLPHRAAQMTVQKLDRAARAIASKERRTAKASALQAARRPHRCVLVYRSRMPL